MATRKVRFNGLMWAAWWPMAVLAGDPCGGNPDAWGPVTVGIGGLENDCSTPSLQEGINLATDPSLCYSDEVRVMRDAHDAGTAFFNGGRIVIANKNVAVIGGWVNQPGTCILQQPTPGDVYTIVDGAGGSTDSVFQIGGNSEVRLSRLTIQNGDDFGDTSSDAGGGIDFSGTGHLFLDHIDLVNNKAALGGGLAIRGGISAYLEDRVQIVANEAELDGGGIYLKTGRLEWNGKDAKLWQNSAGRDGGGLFAGEGTDTVLSPLGEIYVPTGRPHAVISGNHAARNGGGIALDAVATAFTRTRVYVGSHDSVNAQFIANNAAGGNGGAVYLYGQNQSQESNDGTANVCMRGTSLVNNMASRGAAAYLETVYPTSGADLDRPAAKLSMLGGKQCSIFVNGCWGCNLIYNNHSAEGGVIEAERGGSVVISHAVLSGNSGTDLLATGRDGFAHLRRSLVALNATTNTLIGTYDEPYQVQINHNTIADNTITSGRVLEVDLYNTRVNSEVSRNIIWQPGMQAVTSLFSIPEGLVHQNLSNDGALLLMGPWNQVQSTSVDLFDPNIAYFPAANSKALDWAQYEPSVRPELYPDLLGKSMKDLLTAPGRGSATAIADLGAYERQTEAPGVDVFSDSFETN